MEKLDQKNKNSIIKKIECKELADYQFNEKKLTKLNKLFEKSTTGLYMNFSENNFQE